MSRAPAVDYALRIIEFFAKREEAAGIADICTATGINKNAVFRVLEALQEQKWVYLCDEKQKKYRLTMKPFSLLAGTADQHALVRVARPYLERLHAALGDAVYLGIRHDNKVLYLLHFDSEKEVRINGQVGGEYPLYCSAPGKVLLAWEGPEEIRACFDGGVQKRTENTITDPEEFGGEARKIRKWDFAADREEFARGILCIACPVRDESGRVVAAAGISSLTIYDDMDSLIKKKLPLLKEAAKNISICLGNGEESYESTV